MAAFLTSLGTFSPAAVALIAPAAMTFAARSRMSPLVMGIMTINGAHAGAFSPISVSGILVRDLVESNGLSIPPWTLFFASFGINLLLSVLLVAGMITYISMLGEMGTIDHLADAALLIGAPIIVAMVLCYVIGVTSALASSTALLAAIIPLSMPLLQTGSLPVTGVVAALAISATVVDVSQFSTNGALVLANAQGIDRRVFYKQLLLNAVAVVAISQLLCWLILVIMPSLVM